MMKILMTALRMFIMSLFSILLFSSCDHREFLYEKPSRRIPVKVEFDWTDDPGASPAGMTVYFFRAGSKSASPIAYDFEGREGGSLELSPGVYGAICHNSDSDRHGLVGEASFDEFGLRLNDHRDTGGLHSALLPRVDNERLAHSPDSIWIASIPVFEIPETDPLSKTKEGPVVLSFRMMTVVNHYTFIIHTPLNYTNSTYVSATISGMAGTVHPGRGVNGDETVTHLFDMKPTRDGGLRGDILTLGHCSGGPAGSRADEERTHILVVNATLADGQRWSSTHDVTDQIHNSRLPDCVVRLDSVAFPKHTGSGGGLSPTVEGWTIGTHESVGM